MKQTANILLVDDNVGDIELIKLAFEEVGLPCVLSVVHNGSEAVDFLLKRKTHEHAHTPDIILLDLNMPVMGGKEFLDIIKQDERLRLIPVIVLTSSSARLDILESYQRQANCYLIKPGNLSGFLDVARQVENFWMHQARLPQLGLPL